MSVGRSVGSTLDYMRERLTMGIRMWPEETNEAYGAQVAAS
jgi:hypothetical protein